MTNTTTTRAERLRAYRHAAGLRIAQVAAELDTTTDTVYRWEQGRHVPDVPTLDRLAELYHTTPGVLLDGPAAHDVCRLIVQWADTLEGCGSRRALRAIQDGLPVIAGGARDAIGLPDARERAELEAAMQAD